MSKDDFRNFMLCILNNLKDSCKWAWYISFGSQTLDELLVPLRGLWMDRKSIIIRMKNQSTISGKDYKSRYEPIVYWRFNEEYFGERFNEEDIWEHQRTLSNTMHPTMKPIPLIAQAINNSSKENYIISDLFLWSWSTMVASHQLKRKCYWVEIDPKYCQVIIDRMIKLDPTLEIKKNWLPYNPINNG